MPNSQKSTCPISRSCNKNLRYNNPGKVANPNNWQNQITAYRVLGTATTSRILWYLRHRVGGVYVHVFVHPSTHFSGKQKRSTETLGCTCQFGHER